MLFRSARMRRSRAMSMTSEVEAAPTRERASFAFLRSRVIVTLSFAILHILPTDGMEGGQAVSRSAWVGRREPTAVTLIATLKFLHALTGFWFTAGLVG